MWFGKEFFKKLAAVLALAVPAFAADVGPLYFSGVTDEDEQQRRWDELMTFKMWGTDGIRFGHATMTDLSGAVGTAGNLNLEIEKHTIGGPIFVGGNVYGSNGGDTLMSGPVRVKGDFTAGQNGSRYNGTYCIEGKANDNLVKYSHNGADIYGTVYQGDEATTGDCSYENLKDVPTYLNIPLIPDHEYLPAITVNGTHTIDVPPLSEGKLQDFYYERISFNNQATLIIRMESAKSLTRIFLKENINVSSATNIQIVYVDEDAKFVDGQWTNVTSTTSVSNEDYAGNLLFYMKGDMTWPSMNKGTSEQGTFISQGTITVGANLRLAGQFLANNVVVGHEFDGSGFRYVPFDPPILNLEPEVGTKLEFRENDTFVKVPIKLDDFPKVNVYFDYCFEFLSGTGVASSEDITVDENGVYAFPLCSENKYAQVAIMAGSKAPSDDPSVSVWINVAMDDEIEGDERLRLRIKNLSGAIMPGDKREGFFDLTLIDSDKEPKTDNDSIRVVEDKPYSFAFDAVKNKAVKFAYQGLYAQKGVTIKTLPEKGFLIYKGDTLKTGDVFIDMAGLEAEELKYVNGMDEFSGSEVYTSFTFAVMDVEGNTTRADKVGTISIYVSPVNDAPSIAVGQEFAVKENSDGKTVVGTIVASDADPSDKLTYVFDENDESYARVSELYVLDSKTGVITVKEGAKLNYESADSVIVVKVTVTDDASTDGSKPLSATEAITIKLLDENEKHGVENSVWDVDEGAKYPTEIGTIVVTDEDYTDADHHSADAKWHTYSYKIVENEDDDETNDVPFYLNANTGLIKVGSGEDVNIDFETKSVYVFHVAVTDKAGEYTTVAEITVNVNDLNEPPSFGKVEDSYNAFEHSALGEMVFRIPVEDPDAADAPAGKLTVKLSDKNKDPENESAITAEDLFDATVISNGGKTYVYVTVKDSAKLNYETLAELSYDITLTLTDSEEHSVEASTSIVIKDINEEPTVADANFEIEEKLDAGSPVGTVVATDPDVKNPAYSTLTYVIDENEDDNGANDVPFVIDSKGNITVAESADLDFETTPMYEFHVTVSDGEYSGTAKVTVNLTNVNEDPTLEDDGKEWKIAEHSAKGSPIGKLVGSDVDNGDKLTYSLTEKTAGAADLFQIDSKTGEVSVKDSDKLDYEAFATGEKAKVTFDVVITVTDAEGASASVTKTIEVTDVNENPIVKDSEFTVPENSAKDVVVGKVNATDPDTKNVDFGTLYYAVDESKSDKDINGKVPFTVTADGTIKVVDGAVLDFEDKDKNVYVLYVQVSDNVAEPQTAKITITLTDENEDPTLDDDGKAWKIAEHSKKGTEIGALIGVDVDAGDEGGLTYSLAEKTAGAADLFQIDSKTGMVSVKDSAKVDYELYVAGEKAKVTFDVVITVTDVDGESASVTKTIEITDVNEAPSIKSDTFAVDENADAKTFVGQVSATDPDTKNASFGTLYYSIVEGDKVPFTIDNNGKIYVADGAKLDKEVKDSYEVTVKVTDKEYESTAKITININDVNEKPEFADKTPTLNVNENSLAGEKVCLVSNSKVCSVTASDEDCDDGECTALNYELVAADDAPTDYTFFVIDPVTAEITVKADSTLNYEGEKNEYKVRVIVYDGVKGAAGTLSDTAVVSIKINDINDAPVVAAKELSIKENTVKGDTVGRVPADDEDSWSVLTYKLADVEGSTGIAELFNVSSDGFITVAKTGVLNYEKDSVYYVNVIVTDNGASKGFDNYSDTAVVTIKLIDDNDKPVIVPDGDGDGDDDSEDKCLKNCEDKPDDPSDDKRVVTVGIEENSASGTVVFQYTVVDEDQKDVLTVDWVDVNNSGVDSLFALDIKKVDDGWKLIVTVDDGDKLDYEAINPAHEVIIIVKDGNGGADSLKRVIQVVDVNEPPFVVKNTFEFEEHNTETAVIGQIEWGDDKDTKEPAFRDNRVVVIGGDTDVFKVDSAGTITATKRFNYEDDVDTYTLVVKVEDRNDPTLFVVDTMTIKLKNVPEDPRITSTEFEIPENPGKNDLIGTITSEDLDDPENKEERIYALVGTSDFVTVTEDGKIFVKDETMFDYEQTSSFDIKVSVKDPTGVTTDTTITIKIGDVNEAPTVEDQKFTVAEDVKVGTEVGKVKADDPDKKTPEYSNLTYEVVDENENFTVKKDGSIIVKQPLDYESDSVYTVKVRVTDGTYADTATVTIKVNNVVEKSVVEIIKVENTDSTWAYPDTIYTNIPENTIVWKQDGEVFTMDTTLHDGPNVIIITYKDPAKDIEGRDTVVVFFSSAAPEVIVSANDDPNKAGNIYTIVEKTDVEDTSIYVNSSKNDIYVTVRDSVTKKDTSFVVKLDLDTVSVPKKTLETVNSVASSGGVVLNTNPSSDVARVPVNGSEVNVSYKDTVVVGGIKTPVKVSYTTDNDGEVVKTAVVNEKGKVDSIEVITVSYVTTIGGKEVTVSYQADAVTGQILNVTPTGTLTYAESGSVTGGSSAGSTAGSSSSVSGGSSNGSSSSGSGSAGTAGTANSVANSVGAFTVTYDYVDEHGNSVEVTYVVDEKGEIVKNADGDVGYSISYTYVNKYGNSASQSVFIVLDQVGPKVEIVYPYDGQVVHANFVTVTWTVNGVEQDTLTTQGLEKGVNAIVRFYKDKAGNEASDTVFVMMKDGKDIEIAVEQPVTEITKEKLEEYYAVNPPKEGETFAVSIKNPSSGKEMETLIGGGFKTEKGSGDTPYPGVSGTDHLGPTLALDIKLPVINAVGGLATLDDLISSEGLIPLEGVDADNSEKITVDEFVKDYCYDSFKFDGDLSKTNLYKSKMDVKIWIYTSLGSFVDYYTFTQDLNDPEFTNEAGLLQMYFEMKPDKNGDVRTENGRLLATGAYLYKVEVKLRSELMCTLPPVKDEAGKKKGDVVKTTDDLLKPFGYKRPKQK